MRYEGQLHIPSIYVNHINHLLTLDNAFLRFGLGEDIIKMRIDFKDTIVNIVLKNGLKKEEIPFLQAEVIKNGISSFAILKTTDIKDGIWLGFEDQFVINVVENDRLNVRKWFDAFNSKFKQKMFGEQK